MPTQAPRAEWRRPGEVALWVLGLAAVYAGLSRTVTVIAAFGGSSGTTFWPAAGVTVAVLLVRPRREWAWLLGGVAFAEFALNHWVTHLAFDVSVGWALANIAEPLVSASLLLQTGRMTPRLSRSADLTRFVFFAVLFGPAVGATIGAGSGSVFGFYTMWPAVARWFVGDAIGVLVLGPVALVILAGRTSLRVPARTLALWLSGLVVAVVLVLAPWDVPWAPALPFLILPLPALLAFAGGHAAATFSLALVAVGVNGMTAAGWGPFAIEDAIAGLVEAQAFLAMTALTTLIISVLTADLVTRAELDLVKTAYLRTVAHDVRNPLAVISGLADTLNAHRRRLPEDEQTLLLDRISSSARDLDALVTEILDTQRLEVEEPHRHLTDITALIAGTVERIDTRGHPIHFAHGSVLGVVDPIEVERIVENLVVNSVRHTPKGTPIWIRSSINGGGVLIEVDDAGPGIPDALKKEIFEPFRRRGTEEGTGLGLSLVVQFAKRHGGRAWVEDREGGGAAFKVLLNA